MKKNWMKLALTLSAVLFCTQAQAAGIYAEDPSYSVADGIYYSDLEVNCDELINSEDCELFQAAASYSTRDGLSYADCTVVCDELVESDACFAYRQSHPCTGTSMNQELASIN